MSKNKLSVHVDPGECCIVIPINWAEHMMQSYKQMMLNAETPQDAEAFKAFMEAVTTWIEATSVEETYE